VMLEIHVLPWDRHNNVVLLNQLMGCQPSALDNCIYNNITDIQAIKKPAQYQYVITVLSQTLNYKWFSPGPAVSSINKTDNHNITEILLQVALKKN